MRLLEAYRWPGNVRELENTISRATLLEISGVIAPESLPDRILSRSPKSADSDGDMQTLEEVGKHYIARILEKTGGNKAKAAEILGINRTSLWRMINRLDIKPKGCD